MSNPFTIKTYGKCFQCDDVMNEGDMAYYHENKMFCEYCADKENIVCTDCENYKKPEYEQCYECYNETR